MKKANCISLKDLNEVTGGATSKKDMQSIKKNILNRKTLNKIKKIVT